MDYSAYEVRKSSFKMLPHVHNIYQYAAQQKFLKIIQTDLIFSRLDGDEEEQVTVLYNSELSFSERLYDMLDVGLSPICLQKPLETIMMEPLVFIRNSVPHACLEAMKRYNCNYTQRSSLPYRFQHSPFFLVFLSRLCKKEQ